jgi:hypothetical protein
MAESRRRECPTYSNQLSDSGGCVCPGRVSCGFDFEWRGHVKKAGGCRGSRVILGGWDKSLKRVSSGFASTKH